MASSIVPVLEESELHRTIYTFSRDGLEQRVTVHDYEAQALADHFSKDAGQRAATKPVPSVAPGEQASTKPVHRFRTRQSFSIPGIEY
ncbi:hypothetical protein [Methylorubrum extorquens]|uniref:hypothetical protein n=1 Tax=Methylorubrum extorquens TaxID=408 RepID=UPI0013013900|nr:hypothetical protein [Methylorubrum extorquens]